MEHPLRAFRESRGLTRSQLADFLGVNRPTVFRWESGARKISDTLLPTVSEKTGIPKSELRPDLVELLGSDQ